MEAGSSMIEAARDRWFARPDCPVASLVAGISSRGKLRDAQVDAVRTYLFLKVGCGNRPLWELYAQGAFNGLSDEEVDALSLTGALRRRMLAEPGVRAVWEYLNSAEIDAKALLAALQKDPDSLDAQAFFKELLYGVGYTDYLFSLPMGAGKTFLMAAFIYLDLYFRLTDPENAAFARNFVVFAPNGLKSSVIPSLRSIRSFDPAWLFDEATAAQLRALASFELLDEKKSGKDSNRVRNPNVAKVALHQPYDALTGLVIVTNAEKVILDRVVVDDSGMLALGEEPDEKTRVANELRTEIGKLPALSVIIDEVHHAQSDDIKLRAVVNGWVADGCDVNCVLGFSGTPYLPSKKKVEVAGGAGFKSSLIANTVHYYPLVRGIGNFLKRPRVDIVSGSSDEIVREGVETFLDEYGDTVYETKRPDGSTVRLTAKLAVFCGNVARLEEEVAPLVSQLLAQRGLDASELVLKYHRGGTGKKRYAAPAEWASEFAALDTPLSRKRIVLLVQIGKEGWDCRSLAGVVLSQEGDCKKNMVLQTSCRCLREVSDASRESALVVVNRGNAKYLEEQLEKTQHMDLEAFQTGVPAQRVERHSRMEALGLPPIAYRRFELRHYASEELPSAAHIDEGLRRIAEGLAGQTAAGVEVERVEGFDFAGIRGRAHGHGTRGFQPLSYARWRRLLAHEAGPAPDAIARGATDPETEALLREVYERATEERESACGPCRVVRPGIDQAQLRSAVRALFHPRREVRVELEDAGEVAYAELVDESRLKPVEGVPRERFYPDETTEARVLASDKREVPAEAQRVYLQLSSIGQRDAADAYLREFGVEKGRWDNTYQYIPYRFDSPLEQGFYEYVMGLSDLIGSLGLEVYYNGDRAVADYRIDCFERADKTWRRVGKYTPDFLIVQRAGGAIGKTLMVETKGAGFEGEHGFAARRRFIEEAFLPANEGRIGYFVLVDGKFDDAERHRFEGRLAEFFGG